MSIMAKSVLDDISAGSSITVNGVCLTTIACSKNDFHVDVSSETLNITTLGLL